MSGVKIHWLAVGLIVVMGVISYANSFGNPFIWDDQNLIVSNPYIKDIRLIKDLFTKDLGYGTQFSNFYRPLQSLSFELDYYLWGLNPFGFHLTNLLLHIACALVIYFLFALLFPASRPVGLITALLFLVHPIQTESVTYISGRADPQVSLFILLSLFFYVKGDLAQSKSSFFLPASIACFILALLTKETALILPLLILLYDVSFSQGSLRFRDKLKFRYSPFLLVALIYILLRVSVLNFLGRPLFLSETTVSLRLLTSAKILALYLALFILPLYLHMERSIPAVTAVTDLDVLCSLILLIVLGILIARSYRNSKGLFFAWMWFFLNLVPVSNLVPLNANMAEHWLYLPSIGLFLLIAFGFDKLFRRAKSTQVLAMFLLVAIICSYSALTIRRNSEWKDPQSFFQNILCFNPQSAEARNCLGSLYLRQGKLELAIDEFRQAVKVSPQNYKSYGNLGAALRRKKEYGSAIIAYNRALKLRPDIPGLYNNLGNIYADMQKWPLAVETFKKALELYPEFALCHSNLAKAYFSMGEFDSAIAECKQAIVLEPNLVLGYYNLAFIYHSQKEYDLAIAEYKKVIDIAPTHIKALLNLGTVFNTKNQLDQAIEQYQKVQELDPSFYYAYHNLGIVYFKKEQFTQAKNNFLQALELNSEFKPSKDYLKKLKELGY